MLQAVQDAFWLTATALVELIPVLVGVWFLFKILASLLFGRD